MDRMVPFKSMKRLVPYKVMLMHIGNLKREYLMPEHIRSDCISMQIVSLLVQVYRLRKSRRARQVCAEL